MFDQLPDEIILHIINVGGISTASKLILVNKHLTELALEQIIITRNNHPAWKILQTNTGKNNELVINDIFVQYNPSNETNAILCENTLTDMLILCFLKNMSLHYDESEICHSPDSISLYDRTSNITCIWGAHARITKEDCFYSYYEYMKELEIFNYDTKYSIISKNYTETYYTVDAQDCYDVNDVFSPIFPGINLKFWFPIAESRKNKFYELLRADKLPYPHPDTVTGPNAAKYRELYFIP
jgi:hypothetical protein